MKTTEPESRLGVFKSYEEISDRWRLSGRESAFADRDVWAEYEAAENPSVEANRYQAAKNRWNEITADNGEHHALASPATVEAWATDLQEYAYRTRDGHFRRVFLFYDWLLWNADYPHTYNPLVMAASNYPNARSLWNDYADHTQVNNL